MNINEYLNRRVPVEDDFCFVLMPFDESLSSVFRYVIRPVVQELGYRCRRADEHLSSSPIMFEIFDDILRARWIIADLTGSKPNVFYELGIAHALKRNVVLLKRADSVVPFDLGGVRHFEYEDSFEGIAGLRDFLTAALTKTICDEEGEVLDKRALGAALRRACHIWRAERAVLIKFDEFLEIALGLDLPALSEDELAFLCHASAYFGKFMRRTAAAAAGNRTAIRALVEEAAAGTTTRVSWRAAAILENLETDLVEEEVRAYSGSVTNPEIFPEAILLHETAPRLARAMGDPSVSPQTRDKLAEALRQIRAEFRDSKTT